MTYIWVSTLTTIGSDNGLSPDQRLAIIWTNAGMLIGPSETHLGEILIGIHTFSFKKAHLKMLLGKWRPFFLSLNVLILISTTYITAMSMNYTINWCDATIFLPFFSLKQFSKDNFPHTNLTDEDSELVEIAETIWCETQLTDTLVELVRSLKWILKQKSKALTCYFFYIYNSAASLDGFVRTA